MANEVEFAYASEVTLEANGAETATTVFAAADDDTIEAGDHLNYPLCDFALRCTFGAGVAAGSVVNLYRQALNIQGANDSIAPGTTHKHLHVGSFVIPTGQSAQAWYHLADVPLILAQQFSIENQSDQTMSAGWQLYAIPKTYIPGS